jgi:pseudaminic acid synthase
LHDVYGEAITPWEWQPKLQKVVGDLGLDFFSAAFDSSAVDFLEKTSVPVHKIASCELVDIPLIRKMAKTGKPLITSTGMASVEEIEEALQTARQAGSMQIGCSSVRVRIPRRPKG